MKDVATKAVGSKFFFDDCNSIAGEEKTLVTSSGQALSASDIDQIAKAVAIYTAAGDFYEDTGVVNAYVLTPISARKAPTSYIDGFRCRFRIGATNTGTSTVNVATLGIKTIKGEDGTSDLSAGELPIGQHAEIIYNANTGFFELYSHKYQNEGFTTGDWKFTIKAVVDVGWILYYANGSTIGDATSGASIRTNPDCEKLFKLIWTNISNPTANVRCPVVGGIGASADADWTAHKQITLPIIDDRLFAVNGTGDAYNTGLASYSGTQTVTSSKATTPPHPHKYEKAITAGNQSAGTTWNPFYEYANTDSEDGSIGGLLGQAHNNMQPTSFFNVMMKL